MGDLDGLDQVVCAYNLYGGDGRLLTQSVIPAGPEGSFTNELVYLYPIPRSLANTTLEVNITCMDNLQQSFSYNASLMVGAADSCIECQQSTGESQSPKTETETHLLPLALVILALVAGGILLASLLRRKGANASEMDWGEKALDVLENTESLFEQEAENDLFEEDGEGEELPSIVPEGWTMEAYTAWLDGPVPEDWSEEQWSVYVASSKAKLAQQSEASEG